jgi:hypothetical protein
MSGSTVKPMTLKGIGDAPQATPRTPASKTFQPMANSLRSGSVTDVSDIFIVRLCLSDG